MQRLVHRFFWFGVNQDVAETCKTCMEGQRMSRVTRNKAPLMPLLVVEELLKRITIDIIGTLQTSKQGYCFILMIMDFTTKLS